MLERKHDTAVLVSPISKSLPDVEEADWIGVDGGWKIILENGRPLAAVVGDFDSGCEIEDPSVQVERFPVRKNETDSQLAMQIAAESGYKKIILWGALEGRLDHTIANLRCMAWLYPQVICMDEHHRVTAMLPGAHIVRKEYRHVSFFACDPCRITLIGFEYPLSRAPIDQRDFYTCSNKLKDEEGKVILEYGRVICVESDYE